MEHVGRIGVHENSLSSVAAFGGGCRRDAEWLNVLSGLAEIILGVFILEPRVRVLAAWGIIALLIAVFPANLWVAVQNVGPEGPGTGNAIGNWIRQPFQVLFIVWAWWYTRPDGDVAEG